MAESFFEKDQILEEDLEYVAAVFDGEGHFDIRTKKKRRTDFKVNLSQNEYTRYECSR